MKRSILIAMATTLALASCQTDDIMDTHPGSTQNANNAIRFDGEAGKMSRAVESGENAAKKLNNKFVVYGTKTTTGEGSTSTTSVVYNYYNIEYKTSNSDNSTTYNNGWEYVGVGKNNLNKGESSETNQTIKYWDYSASQYDFVAFSFGNATQGTEAQVTDDTDTSNENKVVAKIETEKGSAKFNKLTLSGKASELAKCYVADLVTATKPTNSAGQQAETQTSYVSTEYNKPVSFNFHALATKIQLKIYETIPGYSVKDVKFYSSETDNHPSETPTLFTASGKKIPTASDKATVTVTFNNGEGENQSGNKNLAQFNWEMAESTTSDSKITLGSLKNKTTNSEARAYTRVTTLEEGLIIGKDSKDNASESDIVTSIPANIEDGLTLKVDYTLVSDDGSGETITVKGAHVKIANNYTNWKQNTAYTYIFKIADNTNGNTGGDSGEVGLHPIVFDAVVTEDENGTKDIQDIEIRNESSTPASGDLGE